MNQIFAKANSRIEEVLHEKVRWRWIIWIFTIQGVFSYFTLKQDAILALKMDLPPLIIWLIIMGFLYGCVSNLIICYLIKLTGKLFNAEGSYKNILKSISLAYRPHLYTIVLIIIHLSIAHYFESSIIQNNMIALVVLMLVLKTSIGALAIWTLVLLVRNLMVVQNLTIGKTILNYIVALILNIPTHYLLISEL
ncbi:hypothetical protein GU926_17685 [Nibribacter ruber]|uniref:Yip1 domain-containing protein n=1 Tax=Nibribacter ruber TaxID=2698458 RepID=A0A6P1P3Y5_9BACT|nr:YIP1 family protein [Nibribacter ruber]QHL89164.1 hypothetical protein GU926_17685 [Nibribacter ruber]